MADSIVAKIGIEVDGADKAAAEFRKVGDAAEQSAEQMAKSVAPAASEAGKGFEEAGKGLGQMSEKAGISSREMKALSKVMGSFGAGDLGAQAFGFYRIATSLGVLGVAALAVGKAFQVVSEAFKSARDTAQAIDHMAKVTGDSVERLRGLQGAFATVGVSASELDKTVSNLALSIAKAKAEQAPEWFKAWASDVDDVTNKVKNLAQGIPQALSVLTKPELFATGMKLAFADIGNDMQAMIRRAAAIWEALSPLQRVQFAPAFKEIFTDAQMEIIKKGPAEFDRLADAMTRVSTQSLEAAARTGSFGEKLAAIAALQSDAAAGLEQIGGAAEKATTGFRNWDDVVKENTQGFKTWDETLQQAAAAPAEGLQQTTTAAGDTKSAFQVMAEGGVAAVNSISAAVDALNAKIADLMKSLQSAQGATPAGSTGGGGGGSGFARGGLLGGRGSGTSDSNLAWVSRGEYIVPARAVAMPGVLAFLERLRHGAGSLHGLFGGAYAAGGLVMPHMSMPAFAGGGMSHVTIQFPGLPEITGLRASSDVIDQLRRAAAMAQVRSGGRKPSRYS